MEDWLDRPRTRTLLWLATILLFVGFALLWYYLRQNYLPHDLRSRAHVQPRPVSFEDAGGPISFVVAWAEPFLDFLIAFPLFPLAIVFFWLVSWGGLGRGLGIPDLVWPESWWQRFWVGVAVSLLFANLLFVRYMIELSSGGLNLGTWPSLFWFEGEGTGVRAAGVFLFWTLLPCLLIFYLPKIATPGYRKYLRRAGWKPATAIGLIVGVVITIVLFWLDSNYGISARAIQIEPFHSHFESHNTRHMERELHIRALIMSGIPVFFLAVFLLESRLGGIWSPVWSVCLVIALLSSIYGMIAFYLGGVQFIVLIGLLMVAWISNRSMAYKMSFPALERYRLDPDLPAPATRKEKEPPLARVDLDVPTTKPRPPAITGSELLKKFAENWKAGPGKGTDTLPKMVLFAVSGGGIRAAVWTAAVLEGLEVEMPGNGEMQAAFRDHIRMFTGASGGMLGAALYAADFERKPADKTPEKLSAMLSRDSLWATIQTMVFHDLPAIGVPWSIRWDRGRSLESAWHDNTRPYPTNGDRPGILKRACLHLLRRPLEAVFAA